MGDGQSTEIKTKVVSLGQLSYENRHGLMIPTIQRDYKWGPGHDTDQKPNSAAYIFLEDMIDFFELRVEHDIYFTGTMIVFDESGEPRTQLMDGQQRWTTITALMGIIKYMLETTNADNSATITDINSRFLKLPDGSAFLNSRRKSDKASIDFLVSRLGPQKGINQLPTNLTNNQTYKRDNISYEGTSLNCVISYFNDKLRKHFAINGSFSDTSKLIDFYQTIRDKVFINYSHTTSPTLAYKMFVTANGRGTPLNNFDVFRGLILSRNRIKEFGNEKDLQYVLDQTDSILQELFDRKGIDTGKEIDKLMSQALTSYLTKKVSPHHVLSKLEHSISKFSTRSELDILVEYFQGYITQYQEVIEQKGKVGRVSHLRLKSMKFIQHQQYYIASRVYWGKNNPNVGALVETWENAVMRCLVLADETSMPRRVYSFEERHLNKIKDAGKDSDKQVSAIKAIALDFENMKENPSDSTILTRIKSRQFKSNNIERNKMVCALLALEPMYKKFEIVSNQGNPKIAQLMPNYQWDNPELSFTYPRNSEQKIAAPWMLGNFFLIHQNVTYSEISKWSKKRNLIALQINKNGKTFETYENIRYADWKYSDIQKRTRTLAEQLIRTFPENCLPQLFR
ncbi:DUF262 domain-containing protein [Candidatus Poseidoniaceae archaeon]|nr:DUF262 domain-containing protein [Candidatus Poseidoniaceae archaeon]